MADVVVVTINYRLGALGFMCLKDEKLNVPGNAGLKDQLMAMRFVRWNIERFGGDPDNVTLFGQSAGASCVSWHCVSERSRGLFHKAIVMAGCVLNKFSLTMNKDWAYRLARKLGYEGEEDEKKILDYLQQANPVEIVKVQDSLLQPEDRGRISYAFAPIIEPYKTANTFIADEPIELTRRAWSNEIDMLIGGTSDEGLMYLEYIRAAPALLKNLKLENMVPTELSLDDEDPLRKRFADELRKAYFSPDIDPTNDELGFCKVISDGFCGLLVSTDNFRSIIS